MSIKDRSWLRSAKSDKLFNYDSYKPIIFEKGQIPTHVYFILKGEVFFTNESGAFHYFKL